MKLFCFGFGYVASYFANSAAWESVHGTHHADFPLNPQMLQRLYEATHILHSIPPSADIKFNYEMNPKWFGYLSTTGVYGDTKGDWVDENSPTNPGNERSRQRVEAEREWLNSGLPVNVYRLSGIYGPGRSAIDELKNGTAKRIYRQGQYFSRIYVEDICQILLATMDTKGEIYNCADDRPSPAAEPVEYAAKLLGITPPPLVPYEQAELSEMARSFYTSSRRVKNDKIKALGIKLAYPTYKEGLDAIFTKYQSI
jgi:nucleoside-diphosphate-sugar epimerase